MKLEIKKSKTFSDKTGSLIPFYKNGILKNFSLVRFFLFMEIKNITEQITHIKNVIKYLFLYLVRLELIL